MTPILDQAVLALRGQRTGEAEQLARRALEAEPASLLATQVLGTALLMQGRAAEAIEPLQRAASQSDDPATHTYLARALGAVGRGEEARVLLRQVVGKPPAFAPAFLELGDQLRESGETDEAIAVFERGLAEAPAAPALRVGLAHVHLQRNERATARALFEAVRAQTPERRDAIDGLAKVLALEGETAAAAELYRGLLDRAPAEAAFRLELARCLLELGEREAGEAALRVVAATSDSWASAAAKVLSDAPHGRLFLKPSAMAAFLRG